MSKSRFQNYSEFSNCIIDKKDAYLFPGNLFRGDNVAKKKNIANN